MNKVTTQGLANIVTALLTDPVALKELKTEAEHIDFVGDIMRVVQKHCPTSSLSELQERAADKETTISMVDWRIKQDEPLEAPEDDRTYSAKLTIGNQTTVEISDSNGEPCFGFLLEIDQGVPAMHFDLSGGDNILHLRAIDEGIVLSREDNHQEISKLGSSRFDGRDDNALIVKYSSQLNSFN